MSNFEEKSKNTVKIIAIAAAAVVVIAAILFFTLKDRPEMAEESTDKQTTVEQTTTGVTTEAANADVTEEKETTPDVTKADETTTDVTETKIIEKTTKEKSTANKAFYAPDKNKDVCELLYKKEHIVGVEIKLWGTYFKEIKRKDATVSFFAKYETITKGEDENGTYTDHMTEGYDYYFNLQTKKGYREDWSIGNSEYDNGEPRWCSDGFPEKQKEYDAVKIRYEKDCVVITLFFDKPLVQSNVDAEFSVFVEENIFGTEFGIGNYECKNSWFRYPDQE